MINVYSGNNTNFSNNGDATLQPLRCDLNITINGAWSLEIEVPYDKEERWKLLVEGAIIVVDVDCIRELSNLKQRFRIYDYKKGVNSLTAIAFPIAMESTHDAPIDNIVVTSKTGVQAMAQLQGATSKYTLYTDLTNTGSTAWSNTNVNSAIASGDDDCFIKIWGGEICYDNLKFSVLSRIGENQPAKHPVIYGRNMTDVSYTKDDSGLMTRLRPISQDSIRLLRNGVSYVDSPRISDYPVVHNRYITAPYKLVIDDISNGSQTAVLTRSIQSQITTLVSNLSHTVYNNAVANKVEIEYIKKIRNDIVEAVQDMATANIYHADMNKIMRNAIKDGMEWLKDVSKPEWTWHNDGNDAWWYGASSSSKAVSMWVYVDRIWRYFGEDSYWQKPKDDKSKEWDWVQKSNGKFYGNNQKYFAHDEYVYITRDGQMKEYWFNSDGWYEDDESGDSSYAWHGAGTSESPYWFGDDSTTGKYLKEQWAFIDGTYYYFDEYGYYDGSTKVDSYPWDWVDGGSADRTWFGNAVDKEMRATYVSNQWLKIEGDWYRFRSDNYAVGDSALESETVALFTTGMAQVKTLCDSLNTQAYNLLYSLMTSYCNRLFDTGIDLPSITITVDMVDLSKTTEYADYQNLEKVCLGDSVKCIDYEHGIATESRVVGLTYDCIRKYNATVVIGTASSTVADKLGVNAGGNAVSGGFDMSAIESILTNHTNELGRLETAKQDKLTAGDNIEIVNNVISATGGGGQGLEYWVETSEDFSRTVNEEIPNGWTCDEEWLRTSVDMTMVDNSTTRGWSFSQDTPFAICTCQSGQDSAEWIDVICLTTIDPQRTANTRTIGGKTFYYFGWEGMLPLSNGARWADSDDVIEIGYHGTYEECVDYFINLINIHVGSFLKYTEIGIGDYVIKGGTRYNAQDEYPFTVDKEGNIHAKSVDAIEANPSETPSEELTAININGENYSIPEGVEVVANPEGQASLQLEKLQVGDTIYSMPSGGGGGSYMTTPLIDQPITSAGVVTLSDSLANYDELQITVRNNTDYTFSTTRYVIDEFKTLAPYVANPTASSPHFLQSVWQPSNVFCRIIMGDGDNKIYPFQLSGCNIESIEGIKSGSGGGGSAKVLVYELQQGSRWETFTNPNSDQPLIVEAENNGAVYSWQFIPELLPAREGGDRYITIGSMLSGPPINLGQMDSGGTIYISTNGTYDTSKAYVKVYKVD